MAKASTNTSWSHASDATYQAWVTEFHNLLISAGLVQTSDTGQIADLSVITRPSVGVLTGFRIYSLNDSLQSTAPILIKVWFGTGNNANHARIDVQAGILTNGAGSFTGGRSTAVQSLLTNPVLATNLPARACAGEGFAWITFKASTAATCYLGFGVSRSFDSSGNPSAHGYTLVTSNQTTGVHISQQVIFDSNTVSAASQTMSCVLPSSIQTSVVGADVQFWKHYMATPRMRCLIPFLTTNINDTPSGTERSLTPVGSTARNYISAGFGLGNTCGANAGVNNTMMLIWED